MSSNKKCYSLQILVSRMFSGKISQLNFLILLGLTASLAMLYIGLHVYSYSLSEEISGSLKKRTFLREKKVWLLADYNRLIAPERIIPEVERMGMKQGSSMDVNKLTLYRNKRLFRNINEDPEKVTSIAKKEILIFGDDNVEN